MKTDFVAALVAIALMIFGACAEIQPPASLAQLEVLIESDDAQRAKTVALESWSESQRYLRLAREALARGNSQEADRFATLGMLNSKLAMTMLREASARRNIEEIGERRRQVDLEWERVSAGIVRLEEELERERMREHLEGVVDEARRRAAAQEELREAGLEKGKRETLDSARAQIGREITARARLGYRVISSLVDAGKMTEERLIPILGALEMAGRRSAEGDLAGQQEYAERAGVETRRLWAEVWGDPSEESSLRAIDTLGKDLETAGFKVGRQEFGVLVRVEFKQGKGKLSGGTKKLVSDLAKWCGTRKDVRLLVIARWSKASDAAKKRSQARAELLEEGLVKAGVGKDMVTSFGCGYARPARLMNENRVSAAVLVIPIFEHK